MFHTGAFYEDIDPAGALVGIAAVPEQTIFTSGDDLRVPTQLPFLIGAAALIGDASGVRAQLQSPSLRIFTNLDIEPIVLADLFGSPPEVLFHPKRAIPLQADESLNFYMDSDPAVAEQHYGLVWLADGPQSEVVGEMFSIRATAAITQVLTAWTNGTLAFAQVLPAGRYQVIGMRARSTDAIAMRLVFPEQIARPGVPVVNAIGDEDPPSFRFGRSGVFGEFPHTNPPTLDVVGGAAVVQNLILDLIKV